MDRLLVNSGFRDLESLYVIATLATVGFSNMPAKLLPGSETLMVTMLTEEKFRNFIAALLGIGNFRLHSFDVNLHESEVVRV